MRSFTSLSIKLWYLAQNLFQIGFENCSSKIVSANDGGYLYLYKARHGKAQNLYLSIKTYSITFSVAPMDQYFSEWNDSNETTMDPS